MNLVSVDIETTGLDPDRHEAWEIAVVPVNLYPDDPDEVAELIDPLLFVMPVTLEAAEDIALEIGKFHERYTFPGAGNAIQKSPVYDSVDVHSAVEQIARALDGAAPMGMSVHFDMAFLERLFKRHGLKKNWHHRYFDLGSFAAGAWGADHALSSNALKDCVPNPDAHSALADAEWNVKVYEKIANG